MNKLEHQDTLITRIVQLFLRSRLSIILIIFSLVLGISTLIMMPKEEDPQISVPMADILISAPGASAKEIDRLAATPLNQLLMQLKDVEDVYSISEDDKALVTAKFYVGTNQENALVHLHNQIQTHLDKVPPIVKNWTIKPVTIDDVPIINIVFYAKKYNDFQSGVSHFAEIK